MKICMRMQQLAFLFQRQHAAIIRERMDDHSGVLSRFHHFIQITDRPIPRSDRQRSILPACSLRIEQKTAHQIGGGHIFIARHGDQGFVSIIGMRTEYAASNKSTSSPTVR